MPPEALAPYGLVYSLKPSSSTSPSPGDREPATLSLAMEGAEFIRNIDPAVSGVVCMMDRRGKEFPPSLSSCEAPHAIVIILEEETPTRLRKTPLETRPAVARPCALRFDTSTMKTEMATAATIARRTSRFERPAGLEWTGRMATIAAWF